jgi:hypothetical protein
MLRKTHTALHPFMRAQSFKYKINFSFTKISQLLFLAALRPCDEKEVHNATQKKKRIFLMSQPLAEHERASGSHVVSSARDVHGKMCGALGSETGRAIL